MRTPVVFPSRLLEDERATMAMVRVLAKLFTWSHRSEGQFQGWVWLPIRELAKEVKLPRSTVGEAVKFLVSEGFLLSRDFRDKFNQRRVGYYIVQDPPEGSHPAPDSVVETLVEEAPEQGDLLDPSASAGADTVSGTVPKRRTRCPEAQREAPDTYNKDSSKNTDINKTTRITHLTPYGEAWREVYGTEPNYGRLAGALKPMQSADPVGGAKAFLAYLQETPVQFLNLPKFCDTWKIFLLPPEERPGYRAPYGAKPEPRLTDEAGWEAYGETPPEPSEGRMHG